MFDIERIKRDVEKYNSTEVKFENFKTKKELNTFISLCNKHELKCDVAINRFKITKKEVHA